MINQYGQFVPDYPGQQYYQDPNYMRYIGQHPQMQQQAAAQQSQSRMVEIVPAESVKAAEEFPVGAGQTKLIAGSDDSFIAVKSMSMTGQVTIDIYDKRPPAKPEPPINPEDYVRRDEIAALIAEAIRKSGKHAAAKEEKTDGTV
jgi:hypothetical protein